MPIKRIVIVLFLFVFTISKINIEINQNLQKKQQNKFCFKNDCTWNPHKLVDIEKLHSIQHNINIIDIRNPIQLKSGMMKATISFYFCKSFGKWIKKLIDFQQPLIVYGNDIKNITQVIGFLQKIGYKKILGYSNFSIQVWKNYNFPYFIPTLVDTVFLEERIILDVRTRDQCMKGVAATENIVFYQLQKLLKMQMSHSQKKLQKSKKYVIHCQSGFRAMIAYSFLINLEYDVVVFPYAFQKITKVRIPRLNQLYEKVDI